MRRWVVVVAALVLAAGAVWLWLRSGSPAHDEIDAASKRQLEHILRQERQP